MARARPLCWLSKCFVYRGVRTNKALVNEDVLFIHGKQVSEYEHMRPEAHKPEITVPNSSSIDAKRRFAYTNLTWPEVMEFR